MLGFPMPVVVGAGLLVLVILMIMTVIARMYRKAGPNEALIVYGLGGTHVTASVLQSPSRRRRKAA